ncbi:MAG: DegT/DnrJ/EryC1/StrS family aminotransferase [Clostridiaceae bacterium]|nr:DegT/DnrJ/EryC1/StrS family aminotransferase [Clostridiaceae bacterium]
MKILDGNKTVTLDYEQLGNLPVVSEQGEKNVLNLLRNGEISTSSSVQKFERRFADYVGSKYALTYCNGTSALEAAVFACNAGPGTEVIVPSFTFLSTVMVVLANQATPVFADIDPDTWALSAETIAPHITEKTKAIIVVHVWGTPCDMDPIMELARKHNIKVIEDASHAHGARYKGKSVGSIGDIGCFSFQGSKLVPGGEAGILVSDDLMLYSRAAAAGHYERLAPLGPDNPYSRYSQTGLGHKFRANPLAIALADAAMDTLDARNEIRDRQARVLEAGIADLDFLIPQAIPADSRRVYAYHYMLYDPAKFGGVNPSTLMLALAEEGVICGACGYGRLHQAPAILEGGGFGNVNPHDTPVSLPVSEDMGRRQIMVALRFEQECPELIDQYIAAYHKVAANMEKLQAYERENGIRSFDLSGRSISIISADN